MIEIYRPENVNYDNNGDSVLDPISCVLSMELNGAWELNMEHPIDDRMELINENAVIAVPTPHSKKQLFRIYKRIKTDYSIRVYARPIFIDAHNDCFLFDVRPTSKNGQQALDSMITNPKYKASSNIKTISTAYYVNKNLIQAIASDDENSFLNRWGGEQLYDNYTIHIDERIGQDRGVRAEFGFNLQGIEESVDMSNVVTRIIPKAFNGHMLPGNETVDSANINKYPIVYNSVIEYNDIKLKEDAQEGEESFETLELLYAELRKRARIEYENGIDIPSITYNINIVDLSKTDEYEGYSDLTRICLGDTIHCRHRRLDVETDARVISMTYDCIKEENMDIVLGDYQKNYFDDLSDVYTTVKNVIDEKNHTIIADKIEGILNAMNVSLRFQKNIAQKQDVRAILFEDLDPKSELYGALCIGSKGIQISNRRTADGTDWEWGTAMDARAIYADVITAGILRGIQITNGNNFNVDAEGNMTCRNALMNDATMNNVTMNDIVANNVTMKNATMNDVIANNVTVNNAIMDRIEVRSGTFKGIIETQSDAIIGKSLYLNAAKEGVYSLAHIALNNDISPEIWFLYGDGYETLELFADRNDMSDGFAKLKKYKKGTSEEHTSFEFLFGENQIWLYGNDDGGFIRLHDKVSISIGGKYGVTGTYTLKAGSKLVTKAGLVVGVK